ncbi:MAG: transposase, partial [Candidatus Hodarchaeota archaeon]
MKRINPDLTCSIKRLLVLHALGVPGTESLHTPIKIFQCSKRFPAKGMQGFEDADLCDNRTGKNTQHSISALLRKSIYSRLADHADTNDAEHLSVGPAMRHVAGGRAKIRTAASTRLIGRFETEILTQSKNLELLMNLPGEWVDRVHQRKQLKQTILDMDSS